LPSFLTTVRSRSWTRSKVGESGAPHPSHCRRRPDCRASSDGRLSFTLAVFMGAEGHASAIDRETRATVHARAPFNLASSDFAIVLQAVRW
jgi:hypothetical protein